MSTITAGIVMYRLRNDQVEVLLVHPGGPFFKKKDTGAWSIPKGIPEKEEELQQAARREFEEETGLTVKEELWPLGTVRQKSGKILHAWAMKGDLPEGYTLKSNFFEIEWPPRSGKRQQFPETDKAEFMPVETARVRIIPAQAPLLERLVEGIFNR